MRQAESPGVVFENRRGAAVWGREHRKRRNPRWAASMVASRLEDLEQAGGTHAPTNAHGHDTPFCFAPGALDEQVSRHARA